MSGALWVPLTGRGGAVRAWALVDEEDAYVRGRKWHLTAKGYARRNIPKPGGGQMAVMMHREVMGLKPTMGVRTRERQEIDHINGDRLDNRKTNLRPTTPAGQAQNVRQDPGKYSQERGVSKFADGRRKPWLAFAHLTTDGKKKRVNLGTFETEQEAAFEIRAWRQQHMPFSVEDSP